MKRSALVFCSALLLLWTLVPGNFAFAVSDEALALDMIHLANEGWTEEAPGLWTLKVGENGYRLRAHGEQAMHLVLERLRKQSQELLRGDLQSVANSGRLVSMLSLIERIESALRQPSYLVPDCQRSSTAYGGATTSTHQCGVNAWALASVSSQGQDCGSCDVETQTFASGACSPTSKVAGRHTRCQRSGLSASCTSYSDWLMKYKCEAGAFASVFCPGFPSIDIFDYDDETTCGTKSSPCYC